MIYTVFLVFNPCEHFNELLLFRLTALYFLHRISVRYGRCLWGHGQCHSGLELHLHQKSPACSRQQHLASNILQQRQCLHPFSTHHADLRRVRRSLELPEARKLRVLDLHDGGRGVRIRHWIHYRVINSGDLSPHPQHLRDGEGLCPDCASLCLPQVPLVVDQ